MTDSDKETDVEILLDRLVSASTARDVSESLEHIHQALQQSSSSSSSLETFVSYNNATELWKLLLVIFQTSNSLQDWYIEDGPTLVGQVYWELVQTNHTQVVKALLEQPEPGRWIQALLDVATSHNDETLDDPSTNQQQHYPSTYARVLAMQILQRLVTFNNLTITNQLVRPQLLQHSAGLERLASSRELLDNEQLRSAALQVLTVLSQWPSIAKNWMFHDVGTHVLTWAMNCQQEELAQDDTLPHPTGLTLGSWFVNDSLAIVKHMLAHDAAFAELVLESSSQTSGILALLTRLLDLRGGCQFQNPKLIVTPTAKTKKTQSGPLLSSKRKQQQEDDLDDLLQTGASSSSAKDKTDAAAKDHDGVDTRPIPRLTPAEEDILVGVFEILKILMEPPNLRQRIWKSYPNLVTMVWEMALLTPPPPQVPNYPCAQPSVSLQQKALQITAQYFHSPETMERLGGLDRLLYLVCTGNGAISANTSDKTSDQVLSDRLSLSQSALHVIRQTLPSERAQEMLLHSLAPPPMVDENDETEDEEAKKQRQQQSTQALVVSKLLNTVFEQLRPPASEMDDKAPRSPPSTDLVLLLGATSALTLVTCDNEASRSMLLRLAPTLMDAVLEKLSLVNEDDTDSANVQSILLRFVAQWMDEAPVIVQALLSSTNSTILSALYASGPKGGNNTSSSLAALVLGLALLSMEDESKCGGWTKAGIMGLVSKPNLSLYTSKLENLKNENDLVWSACRLEWKIWSTWYESSVLKVRKCIVQNLVGGHQDSSGDFDAQALDGSSSLAASTNDGGISSGNARSLSLLVAQQTKEMEELHTALAEANRTISLQDKQISDWKRRVESNPTELDEMLNVYMEKKKELEKEISVLKDTVQSSAEKQKSEIEGRESQIDAIKKELEETRSREQEARQETESMQEQLTSLSEAYGQLEADFRQQTAFSASAPPAVTAAGQVQPQGETSEQAPPVAPGGSTEIAMLRADNARLRNDAKSADEWMTMAVERMNEMGAQNGSLQQEVASLKSQLEAIQVSDSTNVGEAQKALETERSLRLNLEAQLTEAMQRLEFLQAGEVSNQQASEANGTQLAALSQSLDDERTRREVLETKMERFRADAKAAMASADEASAKRKEMEDLVESLRSELDSLRSGQEQAGEANTGTVESGDLSKELSEARAEMDTRQTHDQEVIYKLEARIRELEARLDGGLGGYTVEDIHKRDEEIAQLEEANAAAQDWMAKAVEHHQMLANQVADLTHEKTIMGGELKELKTRLSSTDLSDASNRIATMEAQLDEKTRELEGIQRAIEERDRLIESLKLDAIEVDPARLQELESQVCTLKKQLVDQEHDASSVIAQWQESYAAMEKNRNDLAEELDHLREQKCDSSDGANDPPTNFVTGDTEREMQDLKMQASKASEIASEWEGRCTALLNEKKELEESFLSVQREKTELERRLLEEKAAESGVDENHAQQVADLQAQVESLQKQLMEQEKQANEVIQQWQESYTALEAAKGSAEVHEEKESTTTPYSESESTGSRPESAQQARIAELEKELQVQEQQANEVISQWQESYTAMEANKIALERQLEQMREDTPTESQKEDETSSAVAMLESEIEKLKEELKEQEEEANKVISQWQESFMSMETRNKELESELERNREVSDGLRTEEPEEPEKYKDQIADLQARVEGLERELADQEAQANAVISQWQESYTAMESNKFELETELAALRQNLSPSDPNKETDVNTDRVAGLENELTGLKLELEEQGKRSSEELDLAKSQISDLEAEIASLRARLATENSSADPSSASETSKSELETRIKELENELSKQEADSLEAISKWQESYQTLESELEKMRNIETSTRESGDPDGAGDLEVTVKRLEAELADQAQEANDVIARWQESYSALESEKLELASKLEDLQMHLSKSSGALSETAESAINGPEAAVAAEELGTKADDGSVAVEEDDQTSTNQIDLEQENERLKAMVLELSEKAKGISALQETVKSLLQQLEEQEGQSDKAIQELKESLASSEARKSELENDVEDLRQQISQTEKLSENSSREYDSRIAEFEAKVNDLKNQIASQENEAEEAIAQWESSYGVIQSQKDELEKEIEMLRGISASATTQAVAPADADSEEKIQLLQDQLEQQEKEANEAIAEWQRSYESAEAVKAELELELETLRAQFSSDSPGEAGCQDGDSDVNTDGRTSGAANSTKDNDPTGSDPDHMPHSDVSGDNIPSPDDLDLKIVTLEEQVKHLEGQLEIQGKEADDVVSQWQQSYADMESQRNELASQLAEIRGDSALGKDASDLAAQIEDLQAKVTMLEEQLIEQENQATEAIAQWEESYNMLKAKSSEAESNNNLELLEKKISELENDLERQSAEARNVISQWEARYSESEADVEQLRSKLAEMEGQSEQASKTLDTSVDEWRSKVDELMIRSENQIEKITQLSEELEQATELRKGLEEEHENLKIRCSELQGELDHFREQTQLHKETVKSQEQEIIDLRQQVEERGAPGEAAERLHAAEQELARLQESLKSNDEENTELSEALNASVTSLGASQQDIDSLRDELRQMTSRNESLEAALEEKEQVMLNERSEAEAVINEWESCFHDLEGRVAELESEVGALKKERDDLTVSLRVSEWKFVSEKTANQTLLAKFETPESQLLQAGDSLLKEKGSLMEEVGSLRAQLSASRDDLAEAKEKIISLEKEHDSFSLESQEIIAQWKERVSELEEAVHHFQNELQLQEDEANDAISSWEARCLELEEQLQVVGGEQSSESENWSSELLSLITSEMEQKKKLLQSVADAPDGLAGDDSGVDADADTETHIQRIRRELESLDKQLQDAVDGLVEARTVASEANKELSDCLQDRVAENELLETKVKDLSSELTDSVSKSTNLERELDAIRDEKEKLKAEISTRTTSENEETQASDLESELSAVRVEKMELEKECERLRIVVRDLENELREADDALQLQITNEVSEKATELAAAALRQQVDEFRSKLDAEHTLLREEQEARHHAEEEARRFRADLAAFMGIDDDGDATSEIRFQAIQARDSIHREERGKIDQLKDALSRALDELADARRGEAEASDRASKANLQSSMYEQEIVTAKGDLKLLTEKMDEIREMESSRREAMEYRISTLQNDASMLRRSHTAQLEKLQNEFDHVCMERDRLLQSLKDSERNKDAILQAKSTPEEDQDLELTKLRIEKAQLLMTAAEEGARVERRLREARAAEKSSMEADLILQKELRSAAEKALSNVKAELAELRAEARFTAQNNRNMEHSNVDEMRREIETLRNELDALSAERLSWDEQLQDAQRQARETIDKLTEECRQAKTRAQQLEREGRLEAEIQAEVARLKAQASGTERSHRLEPEDDPANDQAEIPVAQLYDIMKKQQQSVEEERSMYSSLIEEHDDLLALLAQHEIVRSTINSALAKIGGPQAVDDAMREAEEKVIAEYGSFKPLP